MEKMRILFLTYQGDIAGSTNSISYLAKGLSERGHQVYMGCREASLLYSMLKGSKVKLIPMEFNSKFDTKNIKSIRDTVLKYDIQIINAQSSKDRYTSMLAKWFFGMNVKLVYTRRQNPRGMNRIKSFFTERGVDKMVVISNGLKQIFQKAGISESFMEVIHNGIPTKRYEQWSEEKVSYFRKQYNLSPNDIVIGSVSRMKKQDQIIKAVAKINDPKIKILFAGITKEHLQEEIIKSGIKNEIIFTNVISGEDILNIYKLLDINILASVTDGFGLVLLEAMAMGCPVIATRFGGITDVVTHEENGLLFEDGDIDQLAAQIKCLLNDQDLRHHLTQSGYDTAYNKFTMEKTIKGYEDLFHRMIYEE
ncbi:MAG: glycosyltransferase family 4 protein [Candidatus Cyclobacteriaceae bacterium M2_1C_046]